MHRWRKVVFNKVVHNFNHQHNVNKTKRNRVWTPPSFRCVVQDGARSQDVTTTTMVTLGGAEVGDPPSNTKNPKDGVRADNTKLSASPGRMGGVRDVTQTSHTLVWGVTRTCNTLVWGGHQDL